MGINRGRKDQIKGEVRVGDFSRAFGKEMIKYTLDVEEEIAEITAQLAKAAAKELNEASKEFIDTGSSGYDAGWAAKNISVRHRGRWILHNKYAPGLAHLLEYGHAKKGGGRVAGKIHIKPIEEKLIQDYEDNVKAIIENGVI